MKKVIAIMMVVIMAIAMSFTAHAEEKRNEFKKVTWLYADELYGYMEHTKLTEEELVYTSDPYTLKVSADDNGTITMKCVKGDVEVDVIIGVYVNGEDMMVFYTVDGYEYVSVTSGEYAREFYDRC